MRRKISDEEFGGITAVKVDQVVSVWGETCEMWVSTDGESIAHYPEKGLWFSDGPAGEELLELARSMFPVLAGAFQPADGTFTAPCPYCNDGGVVDTVDAGHIACHACDAGQREREIRQAD